MRLRAFPVVVALLFLGLYLLKFGAVVAVALLMTAALLLFTFSWRQRFWPAGILVLANIVYWLASGFLLGATKTSDFWSVTFIGGEGRIFVSYLSALMVSAVAVRYSDTRFMVSLMAALALFTIALFLFWLATGASILVHKGTFVAFFTSHSAAGAYFGLLAVFLAIYGHQAGRPTLLALGVFTMIVVFATGSRSAILASLAATAWYLLQRGRVSLYISGAVLVLGMAVTLPLAAPGTYQRLKDLVSPQTLSSVQEIIVKSQWEPGRERELEEDGGDANALSRVLYWKYALSRFAESPLVGIGFGRFNDQGPVMAGIPNVIYLAVNANVRWVDTLNAHNSYFHLLCETGIIGLGLLLSFWFYLYAALGRLARELGDEDRHLRGYAFGARALLVFVAVVALFGHGLAAPSVAIPVLVVAAVGARYGFLAAKAAPVRTRSYVAKPVSGGAAST